MSTKIPLPNPENIVNYPANAKAVMVSARGYIRVVERHYYSQNLARFIDNNLSIKPNELISF